MGMGVGMGMRPDSFVEEHPGSSQQWPARSGMRNSSMPQYYAQVGEAPSPSHSHQQSYETMTSGSDENGKSTNPSSQNSSFDQLHQLRKPEDQSYDGQNGYNGNFSPVSPPRQYGPPYGGPQNGNYAIQQRGPAPPPPKEYVPNNPRVPIKLNSGSGGAQEFENELKKTPSPKRQSWFKRKFSRRDS